MSEIQLLLQRSNQTLCGSKTVGILVGTNGVPALWTERAEQTVDVVVIHYMSAVTDHPDDPYAMEYIIEIFARYGVSSHYVIGRNGCIYQCVPDIKKAWHAGGSIMPDPDNRTGVNEFSIGIELLATETSGFSAAQYNALTECCLKIETVWSRRMVYVGHDMIAGARAVDLGMRKDCKVDPGPLFDWDRFYDLMSRRRG